MTNALPTSLSPHICILSSPDLVDLLQSSGLPPLHHVLQSFSPLPQVTTRTTSLTSVPHSAFALRFSDLVEIEFQTNEDEEKRAARTLDWIGERLSHRAAKWVEDVDSLGGKEPQRTPWWDEVRRCAEGDHIPGRSEGWNHPVAVIFAVSTTAPNPLQAVTALHSRAYEFPSWVDTSNVLRYTVIIHPKDSSLNDDEAVALLNAVKKQYGLNTYILPLSLPSPPPDPIPIPAQPPRLPPAPSGSSAKSQTATPLSTIRLCEADIQQTAKFTREFVVMNLLPWMEKCVLDWNESFSSSRRLPSRLFSSTRRLFGTQSSSTATSPTSTGSATPISSTGSPINNTGVTQQRRLAEFSTILGDVKLATSVWESLRKEAKGGSDILPMLLAPSPAIQLHASYALSSTGIDASPYPSATAQLRALTYAARWDVGVSPVDLLSEELSGEKWLVWAAGNSEEASSAILLAQAALLSARKHHRRKASFHYFAAAIRLEKYGIKPLTMHFLRSALQHYEDRIEKTLSPLFWEAQNISQISDAGFDAIRGGIEHPLGRLLYTSGDSAGAVRHFLGLLTGNPLSDRTLDDSVANGHDLQQPFLSNHDKEFLDDFKDAYTHYLSKEDKSAAPLRLNLPFTFCNVRKSKIRLPYTRPQELSDTWDQREAIWRSFLQSQKRTELIDSGGYACTGETFWFDVQLRNPLNADVTLSNLTVVVENAQGGASVPEADVEIIDELVLEALEMRTVPIAITPRQSSTLILKDLSYSFVSLLPASEPLSYRGRRLNKTPAQWREPTYEPDTQIKLQVKESGVRLQADFVDDSRLVLCQGESKQLKLWFSNTGTRPISEVWVVSAPDDNLCIEADEPNSEDADSLQEVVESTNTLSSLPPRRIALSSPLSPEDSQEVEIWLHTETIGEQHLSLLLVYRESQGDTFSTTCVSRRIEVSPLLQVSTSAEPSMRSDLSYLVGIALDNVHTSPVEITQVTCVSATWDCRASTSSSQAHISPGQSWRAYMQAERWSEAADPRSSTDYIARKVGSVLSGHAAYSDAPPPTKLLRRHGSGSEGHKSHHHPQVWQAVHNSKRRITAASLRNANPHIPATSHPFIFPLHHPYAVDLVVFWKMDQERQGHLLITGLQLGASHGLLNPVLDRAESTKSTRNMYAETAREKAEIIRAIKDTVWNTEMNPLVLTTEVADHLEHDFSKSEPCLVPVTFNIRNFSLTQASKFRLQLSRGDRSDGMSQFATAPFHGQLTFHGTIPPSGMEVRRASLWVTQPGIYVIGYWQLLTQVLEGDEAAVGKCYSQIPVEDSLPSIIIDAKR